MAMYIDAEKISSHIRENFSIDKTKNADICFAFIDFMNWLDEQPTADVVEVTRCKDCKHGRKTNRIMSPEKFFKEDCVVCECEDVVGDEPMIYVPTHFCSYGTPKERGGEK